jgi:hypothetical protein
VTLDLDQPDLAAALEGLHPYLGRLCAAAGERALFLHADEVTAEHLLDACMRDEDCAAHALVVHAFADPETLSFELTALCPGVMVVGSKAALPFSTLALEALRAARAAALAGGADEVETGVVLGAALDALPREDRAGLEPVGAALTPQAGKGVLEADGPLFRGFSDSAKGALSKANRAAHALGEPSIGPAQLVLACLAAEPGLPERAGISLVAARSRLVGRTLDPTAPKPRRLPASPALVELLGGIPAGGGSLALLAAVHARGGDLSPLLERQRITEELLTRAAGAFNDPG